MMDQLSSVITHAEGHLADKPWLATSYRPVPCLFGF